MEKNEPSDDDEKSETLDGENLLTHRHTLKNEPLDDEKPLESSQNVAELPLIFRILCSAFLAIVFSLALTIGCLTIAKLIGLLFSLIFNRA